MWMLKLSVVVHAALLMGLFPMVCWAWGSGHVRIRTRALEYLPAWQQDLLSPASAKLTRDYLCLQDAHAGGNRPDLDPYCKVPGASVSLHDVCEPGVSGKAMVWYLEQVTENWQAGKTDEAAKYLGVLCHWIEDPGSPTAHCAAGVISEYALRELLPPPSDKERYHYLYGYSGIGDRGDYTLPQAEYKPHLLGVTFAQASLHLYQAQRRLQSRARAFLIPILHSELYGDGTDANTQRGRLALENARVVADLLYTVLCLATGRFEAQEAGAPASMDLTRFLPEYQGGATGMPHKWVPFLIGHSFDQQRNLLPLQLATDAGIETFERGIGMGVPFELNYVLAPGGVYKRVTCIVGLHPAAGEQGSVRFALKVNGKESASVGPIAAGAPSQALTAELPEGAEVRLTLRATPGPESRDIDNLAVWAAPTLHTD